MRKTKYSNRNKPYLSDLLRPKEIQTLLRTLGLEWQNHKVNTPGWVTIQSPLRMDSTPSFRLNINHGGFIDFGSDVSGNIVLLVSYIKGYNIKNSEKWILKTLNINPNLV